MKKQKKTVPTFQNAEEEAAFWDQHETTEYDLDEVEEVLTLSPSLRHSILQRWQAMRAKEWLPLPESQTKRLRAIAREKGVPWELLVYEWLEERLKVEA